MKEKMVARVEKGVREMLMEYGRELVGVLASKYGFDRVEAESVVEIVRESPEKSKKETRLTPKIPLPFCGVVEDGWCRGLRLNHGLHTQCTQEPGGDGLCKTCTKQCEKNSTGKPTYGLIEERVARYDGNDVRNWRSPSGTLATPYTKVMEQVGISREDAISEAAKFGWTIPEQHFTVSVGRAGRPKKSTATSDTESESGETAPKKRGRPKKEKKVVNSNVGDDLIASLLAQAPHAIAESDDDEIVHVPPVDVPTKKKKRRETKHKLVVPKSVKAEPVKAEPVKAEPVKAEPVKAVPVKAEPVKAVPVKAESDSEPDTPLCEAAFGENMDDEEVSVSRFEFDGRTYLRATDDVLYDVETQEEVGIWNESRQLVQALPSGDWD